MLRYFICLDYFIFIQKFFLFGFELFIYYGEYSIVLVYVYNVIYFFFQVFNMEMDIRFVWQVDFGVFFRVVFKFLSNIQFIIQSVDFLDDVVDKCFYLGVQYV